MAKDTKQYFAAFDTETGGLDPDKADLLTTYMGIFDEDLNLIDEVNLKLKPDGGRWPIADAGALAVNKIDLEQHMANPETLTYSEGRKKLTEMVAKYSKRTGRSCNMRPLGYNVPFDENWVWKHLVPKEQWDKLMHYKRVDVMERVDFLKECQWFPSDLGSLGTVVAYLGLPTRDAHDAREDVLMTVDVYRRLLQIMKDKKENAAQVTENLLELIE